MPIRSCVVAAIAVGSAPCRESPAPPAAPPIEVAAEAPAGVDLLVGGGGSDVAPCALGSDRLDDLTPPRGSHARSTRASVRAGTADGPARGTDGSP